MISNNGVKVFIKKYAKEKGKEKIQVSFEARVYLKEILESVAKKILANTIRWESKNRITKKNIENTINKNVKSGDFLNPF